MKYKKGQKIKARVPFMNSSALIHIEHVLDVDKNENKLIVYRIYGKHKQWWHYFSCFDYEMDMYVKFAKQQNVYGN